MSRLSQQSAGRWIVLGAALIAASVTARLGWWQLDRGAQKQALADAMRARAAMPPMAELPPVGALVTDVAQEFHRHITVQGRWLPQHVVYLDNRQIVEAEGKPARVGFDVLMPLQLRDGSAVVVQRGWVPRDFNDRQRLPAVPADEREVRVEGRYAPPPARLYEFNQSHTAASVTRLRQNLDVDAYARETGLRLRPGSIVQTGTDEASGVVKRVWALPDTGVARHQGYAFQWFALSALVTGLYLWFQVILPRRRAQRRS